MVDSILLALHGDVFLVLRERTRKEVRAQTEVWSWEFSGLTVS